MTYKIKEDLNNIDSEELDEIAKEFSLDKSNSRLGGDSSQADDSKESKSKSRKRKREPKEEKPEKGQTTLFSFEVVYLIFPHYFFLNQLQTEGTPL